MIILLTRMDSVVCFPYHLFRVMLPLIHGVLHFLPSQQNPFDIRSSLRLLPSPRFAKSVFIIEVGTTNQKHFGDQFSKLYSYVFIMYYKHICVDFLYEHSSYIICIL